jgi:F0F1-type ATP synthase membrane subunit b/b'
MNLFPDHTIVYQIILFVLVWKGLSRIVFTPIHEVFDERSQRTVAAEELAQQLVVAAQNDRETYDIAVRERRTQLATESANARSVAQEESARLLEAARAAANQELSERRTEVAGQIAAARQRLAAGADDIAQEMLRRVSGGASS